MKAFKIWWQLLRGVNLLMMVATLGLVHWMTDGALARALWLALTVGTVAVAAAGNLINDICDREMDALNKPQRVWIGQAVRLSTAWRVYAALQGLALGAALLAQSGALVGLFAQETAGLYAYSRHLKCRPLVGNVVVDLFCALLVFQYWALAYEALSPHWRSWLLGYAGFAGMSNWVREWVKDLQDQMGDAAVGCRTLAVRWSWAANRRGLLGLWACWLLGLCWAGLDRDFMGIHNIRHAYGGVMGVGMGYIGWRLWQL